MYSLSLSLSFLQSSLPFPLDEGLSQSAQRVNGTRVQCANLTSQSECLFGQGQSLTALPTPSSKPSSLSLLLSLSIFISSISFRVSPLSLFLFLFHIFMLSPSCSLSSLSLSLVHTRTCRADSFLSRKARHNNRAFSAMCVTCLTPWLICT